MTQKFSLVDCRGYVGCYSDSISSLMHDHSFAYSDTLSLSLSLLQQTTEESLQYYFEQFGIVSKVDLMRDRNTGDPRGFCFVVFKGSFCFAPVGTSCRCRFHHHRYY